MFSLIRPAIKPPPLPLNMPLRPPLPLAKRADPQEKGASHRNENAINENPNIRIYKENCNKFLTCLTKEKAVTYRMKRAKG